jgi:hypothetical protein
MLGKPISVDEQVAEWQRFYANPYLFRRVRGQVRIEPSQVFVPGSQRGFDYLLVVAPTLTVPELFVACAKKFPCYSSDLDVQNLATENDRVPGEFGYAVWIRSDPDADDEYIDLRERQIRQRGVRGMTLLERMLWELRVFDQTGLHPDPAKPMTLCTGSQSANGKAPFVHWDPSGTSNSLFLGPTEENELVPPGTLRCRAVWTG